MKYIALKPCRFDGKDYQTNDIIHGDCIEQSRLGNLTRMGVVAVIDDAEDEQQEVKATVSGKKGRK